MADGLYDPLPQLIDYASRLRYADLSPEAIHETKRRAIDAVGCAVGALQDERLRQRRLYYLRHAVGYEGAGNVLGSPEKLSLPDAAFLNSTMSRWLDYNDTYLAKEPAHPSDNIGLMLAIAGARPVSGADLIAATVVAYDAQCRLCEAASLRSRGFDHVNYILISATLGGARLLGFSPQQMYDAVAFALNSNIALRQAREGELLSEQKNMAAGDAVRAAAWSLEKVLAGSSGPDDIVGGIHGFVRQVSGPIDAAPFDGLGEHFFLVDTYLKKYPVEYHGQTIVEHALALREQLSVAGKTLADVRAIRIDGYEAQVRIIGDPPKRRPATKETADHSLYFALAAALLKGRLTFDDYAPDMLTNPEVLALIDRMTFVELPEWTALYFAPAAERAFASRVTLELNDGSTMEDTRHFPSGHPRNPMSDADLEEKVRALAQSRFPNLDTALGLLWRLEALPVTTAMDAIRFEA